MNLNFMGWAFKTVYRALLHCVYIYVCCSLLSSHSQREPQKTRVQLESDDVSFPDTKANKENYVKVTLRNLDKVDHCVSTMLSIKLVVFCSAFVFYQLQIELISMHLVNLLLFFSDDGRSNTGAIYGEAHPVHHKVWPLYMCAGVLQTKETRDVHWLFANNCSEGQGGIACMSFRTSTSLR